MAAIDNLPKDGRSRAGRPKGARNKIAGDIRAMIEGALAACGGQKYLEVQAIENPVAFMGLVGRCLPKDITVSGTIGQYTAIPTEQRHSDSLAGTIRAAATGDSARPN